MIPPRVARYVKRRILPFAGLLIMMLLGGAAVVLTVAVQQGALASESISCELTA